MRHIATSQNSSIFLTAEFEKKVYSWNIDTYEHISEFNTVLDFGGQRLAISGDGTRCIAAAYSRYGISMYDILTGSVIWHRRDINKVQFVTFDPLNETIYVGADEKPLLILNKDNGEDNGILNTMTKVYFDLLSTKRLLLQGQRTVIGDEINIISPTFAFLDIQGIGRGMVLSAVGNDLMYYNYYENKTIWRITPAKGEHFIKTAYSETNETIFALLYKYNEPRIPPYYLLYAISAFDGVVKFIFSLPTEACEFGFARNATKLICSSGEVFDLSYSEPTIIYNFNWE